MTDTILFYAKSEDTHWNPQYRPHKETYLASHYRHADADGRQYRHDNIIRSASMGLRPNLTYEYNGFTPPYGWRVVIEKLRELDANGRIAWSRSGTPYLVRYLDEQKGEIVDNLWDDVTPLNSQAQERLGYPTQKPLALLERIIEASSKPSDVVLDPFCGCGTTIEAAQKLGRSWIGVDITHLATTLIKVRLRDAFGDMVRYRVIGEPTTAEDAAALAESDKYQFQWWALGLVGARPVDQKKGADKGVDGRTYLRFGDSTCQIIFSVKAGKLKATDLRDLRGVTDREKADIGVLLSFETPTKLMRAEAASAGFYKSPWGDHPRLQLLTVAELLAGASVDAPKTAGVNQTYKQAPRHLRKAAEPLGLFDPHTPMDKPTTKRRKK